jgi:WD40 repeat protein
MFSALLCLPGQPENDGFSESLVVKRGRFSPLTDYQRVTPDGRHLVEILQSGGAGVTGVFVDGVNLSGSCPQFYFRDWLYAVQSQKLAFVERCGQQEFVIFGGKRGPGFDFVDRTDLTFSPDGDRLAYKGSRKETQAVVVDGTESVLPAGVVDKIEFSADSKHVAYMAHTATVCRVVLDGMQLGSWDEAYIVGFNPATAELAYEFRRGGHWFLVTGKRETGPYDSLREAAFSEEGKHFTYVRGEGEKYRVYLDGMAESRQYDFVQGLRFSNNGEHLVYIGERAGLEYLVIDGREGSPHIHPNAWFDHDVICAISDDGKHAAAVMHAKAGDEVLVWDGRDSKPYDLIDSFVLSPNGERIAFAASKDHSVRVIVDGAEDARRFGDVGELQFSGDSRHVVYIGFDGTSGSVVFDGKVQTVVGSYRFGESPFSPDGKHLAYWNGSTAADIKPSVSFWLDGRMVGRDHDGRLLGPAFTDWTGHYSSIFVVRSDAQSESVYLLTQKISVAGQ